MTHAELQLKETCGQTCGLGNLEKKHIGELAITGVLLNAVKRSGVVPCKVALNSQSVGFFRWLFFAHILQRHPSRIARVAKLQQNMKW